MSIALLLAWILRHMVGCTPLCKVARPPDSEADRTSALFIILRTDNFKPFNIGF